MRRRKMLGAAALVLLLLPILGLGGMLGWLALDQPVTAGVVAVPGLAREVPVARDGDGVPHIFAASEEDGYFALGFVHAQDRLWQMETMRRAGAGRLAELFGTRVGDQALKLDRRMRTLGLHRRAEASYKALAPETRRALDAYAAGVNAYLAGHVEPLPLEFQILNLTPEPWKPADSLVWGKLMAAQLGGNAREELFRSAMIKRLPPERQRDLFPGPHAGEPVTLAALIQDELQALPFERVALDEPPPLGPSLASNEWVLAGSRTTTGMPILANDPHLGLDAPILWYLARIETPGLSLIGATVPGLPFHVLAQNGKIAWGLTTTHADTEDLFVERVDPHDPDRYLTPTGSEPFLTRKEIIHVAGQADEILTVRETRHGPVVSDLEEGRGAPSGHVLALAATMFQTPDTTPDALYRLDHARSAAEARSALAAYRAPVQNVVYADEAGTIGFVTVGLIPVRRKGDGAQPVPGWDGAFDWSGTIPQAAMPAAENPPSGQFINANNAVVTTSYPYLITANWPESHRAQRIRELLGNGVHSPDDIARFQLDQVSLAARELLGPMLAVPTAGNPRLEAAVALLRAWDATMAADRPEPLIFQAWLYELNRALFAKPLGPLYGGAILSRVGPTRHALEEASGWCEDGCPATLRRTLEAALTALAARYGEDPANWRWGAAHVAPLAHTALGRLPLVGALFRFDLPVGGDSWTVNAAGTRFGDAEAPLSAATFAGPTFADAHGPGYRAVYDLADPANSRFVIATGQSGNPLSGHWSDFAQRWRDGGAVHLTGRREDLVKAGASVLVLKPNGYGARR